MPIKMLIIDDEFGIRELLLAVFSDKEEFEVICANDGQEGLKIAHSYIPDIVMLDVGLPNLSGYDLCRLFRADPDIGRVKVLMLSGMAQRYDVLKAKEAGADAYFTKPFDIKVLVDAVRALTRA